MTLIFAIKRSNQLIVAADNSSTRVDNLEGITSEKLVPICKGKVYLEQLVVQDL
jgi:hypothetical protein